MNKRILDDKLGEWFGGDPEKEKELAVALCGRQQGKKYYQKMVLETAKKFGIKLKPLKPKKPTKGILIIDEEIEVKNE